MDEDHRNIILENISNLIRSTNYEALMERCMEQKLLFLEMKQDIENHPYTSERHKLLFEKITRRGPNAFKSLLSICKHDFPDAAAILETKIPNNNCVFNDNKEISLYEEKQKKDGIGSSKMLINRRKSNTTLEPYTDTVYPKLKLEIKKSTEFYNDPKLDTYRMRSKNRGVFFLVNIINFKFSKTRNGANIDRDNLIHLFRGMGFETFYYQDIDASELTELIVKLQTSKYLRHTDCFFFALLTHGGVKESTLYAEFGNGSVMGIENIISQFNNQNCPQLTGKPKIFMFPFCRGYIPDPGVPVRHRIETDSLKDRRYKPGRIPTINDVKILYGTVPGYETFRDPEYGSRYIDCFCRVFAEYAHDTSLDDLVKMIGNEMEKLSVDTNEIMTPNDEGRGFFKALFFNPGFYSE